MKFHLILIGLQIKYIDCTKRQIGCKMLSMSKVRMSLQQDEPFSPSNKNRQENT